MKMVKAKRTKTYETNKRNGYKRNNLITYAARKVKNNKTNSYERICLEDSLICDRIEALMSYIYGVEVHFLTLGGSVKEILKIIKLIRKVGVDNPEITEYKYKYHEKPVLIYASQLINETINPQIKVHDYLELLVNEINLWSEDRNKCIHMMAKLDFDVNKDIKARLVAIKECAIKGYHLWTLIRNITSYLMKKDIFKYIEQKAIINTTTVTAAVTGVAASLISASTSTL
jgi:hypothetical protein